MNKNNPAFYCNRARCFKEQRKFAMMLSDATEAIQLDDTYIKAFMAMGEALIELGKLDDTSCA